MRQVNQLRRFIIKSTLVLTLFSSVSSTGISAFADAPLPSSPEQYLFAAANRERSSRGLQQLKQDPVLARVAAFHARQMAAHEDISHEFPGEPDLATRAARAGVHFSLISENVASAPEPTEIHDMWMHSTGHRENLLDPDVNAAGISVVRRDGQFYAVEDFASIVQALSFSQQESTVATLMASSGITVANRLATQSADAAIKAARETCTMSTGYAGDRKPWFVMRYTASTLVILPETLKSRLSTGKYHQAVVGACSPTTASPFTGYNIAVLLYP
jgi:uncharacterized protein YkwD